MGRQNSRGTPQSPYHITKASYALLVLRSGRLAIGRLQRNVVPLHRINSFTTCALLCHPQHKHTSRGARICCFSSRLDYPVQLMCPTPGALSLTLSHPLLPSSCLPPSRSHEEYVATVQSRLKEETNGNGLSTRGRPCQCTAP